MCTKASILKWLGVTVLVLLEANLALTSMNLWDALASNIGVNLNGPTLAPPEYEGKLCSDLDIICYPCKHYNKNHTACDRRPECGFDCGERKCKDIKDTSNSNSKPCHRCEHYSKNHAKCNSKPNCVFDCEFKKCKNKKDPSLILGDLNCTSQCHNPCGCQVHPNCFYSERFRTQTKEATSSCVTVESSPGLDETNFEDYECYRGGTKPFQYYFSNGKLSPLVHQADKGNCEVDYAAEYVRKFNSAYDDDRSSPCTTVTPIVYDHKRFYELVVVFDKLDDWLPAGEHRVFSLSIFNAFRWSVTLRRDDFAAAKKIQLYWSFVLFKSHSKADDTARFIQVKGLNQNGYSQQLNSFDIQLCDQCLDSCFRGNGIVRPALIRVNEFKLESST